jgi:hypothetical protein
VPPTDEQTAHPRLALLLAMAMFVFVIDTSLMNVSISAVVRDLDTTVSGVQAAVAIEALVSAAFILIGSKWATSSAASVPTYRSSQARTAGGTWWFH